MKPRILFVIIIALLVASCSQPPPSPVTPLMTEPISGESNVVDITETSEPSSDFNKPTSDIEVTGPAASAVPVPTSVPAVAVEEVATDKPVVEPEATPEKTLPVNGVYGDTYFRGAEDAPVTIIDYSDFL